jgi:hypothetical protein
MVEFPIRSLYGSSRYGVRITPLGEFGLELKCTVEFFDRRHKVKEMQCSSVLELVSIIRDFWEENANMPVFDNRLASWMAEYFNEIGVERVTKFSILEMMKTVLTPSTEKQETDISDIKTEEKKEQQVIATEEAEEKREYKEEENKEVES